MAADILATLLHTHTATEGIHTARVTAVVHSRIATMVERMITTVIDENPLITIIITTIGNPRVKDTEGPQGLLRVGTDESMTVTTASPQITGLTTTVENPTETFRTCMQDPSIFRVMEMEVQ